MAHVRNEINEASKRLRDQTSFCTFRVGPMKLGVEVSRVQEVIREQTMTRIPGANDVVHGLLSLRGQIVTALNLPRRLGLHADEEEEEPDCE